MANKHVQYYSTLVTAMFASSASFRRNYIATAYNAIFIISSSLSKMQRI